MYCLKFVRSARLPGLMPGPGNRFCRLFVVAAFGVLALAGSRPAKAVDAEQAAGVVGGALLGAAAFAAISKSIEEQLEHFAVERLLELRPDLVDFQLSLVMFDASSIWDLSSVSAVPCVVIPKGGEPFVLMLLFDSGWVNATGLDLTKVSHRVVDRETWSQTMTAVIRVAGEYTDVASDRVPVFDRRGIRALRLATDVAVEPTAYAGPSDLRRISARMASFEVGGVCLQSPLRKLEADEYRVQMVDGLGRVVYNERSVQLFLEEWGRLVRLHRTAISNIHAALFPDIGPCARDSGGDGDGDW